MDVQALLTGGSLLILLVGAALTAPLSFFLIWLYRRAVLRGMNVPAGVTEAALPSTAQEPPGHSLRITVVGRATRPAAATGGSRLEREATLSLRRVSLAYAAGGLAFAALIAGAWSAQAGGGFLSIRLLLRLLLLTLFFAWPIVLALSQLAAFGWRDRLGYAALYLALSVTVGAVAVLASTNRDPFGLIVLWLDMNSLATLLLIACLTRRVRAVGPLVLAFMTAGIAGAIMLPLAVGSSEQITTGLACVFAAGGLGGRDLFFGLNLVGFVALGAAGWGMLRLIGHRYRLKRMSDQSLALDAMWLLFAVANSVLLASGGWIWILAGPAAFFLYKLVLWGAFARFVRPAAGAYSSTLLLLRVFSLGPRSLRLFDALAKCWLRVGPITLIAGPDLATGLVEPHEFLDFLGGRVSRQFVQGREDLERRMAELDTVPDPDGRYRVSEFFCRSDTWQMTMRQLAAGSDAVLMDLRSFSPSNRGCQYELEQLLDGVPLPRVVMIVDDTTDRPFLEDTLQSLWQNVPADSPNRSLQDPEVRLFEAQSGTGTEVRTLLSLLFGQQRPTAVGQVAGNAD